MFRDPVTPVTIVPSVGYTWRHPHYTPAHLCLRAPRLPSESRRRRRKPRHWQFVRGGAWGTMAKEETARKFHGAAAARNDLSVSLVGSREWTGERELDAASARATYSRFIPIR